MALLFKFLGLFLVFCAFSLWGFSKNSSLKKRVEILGEFTRSLSRLAGFILAEQDEIEKLISLSFSPDILKMENGNFRFESAFLESEDLILLNEFLQNLGANDSESEYKRTLYYSEIFKKQLSAAEKKLSSLGRLYSTSGVLCGLLICIFFI